MIEPTAFGYRFGKRLKQPKPRPKSKENTRYLRTPSTHGKRCSPNMVTLKELCALDVIVRLWFEHGKPPTHEQIRCELGLKQKRGCHATYRLERKGFLERKKKLGPLSLTLKGCSALRMQHTF